MENNDHQILLEDGRKLGYAEYGDSKGTPIFFFHGWPGSRLSGAETEEAAKKLRIRIISVDRPGFGLSDYKDNRILLDWPDDIAELADVLKIKKFSVIGVSGGGPYVAVCAYKLPNRINKAAIVVGLGPPHIKGNLDGMSFLAKLGWKTYHKHSLFRMLSSLGSLMQFTWFPELGLLLGFRAKEDQKLLQTKLKTKFNKAVKESYRQGIKGLNQDLKLYSSHWGFDISQIRIPVFLWYGAKDKNVSLQMGKYYKSQIPNSTLFIDKHGGHLSRNNHEEEILNHLI